MYLNLLITNLLWRDTDNLGWTYKSIIGYEDFF